MTWHVKARHSPIHPKAVNKLESAQEQQASSTLPSRSSGHLGPVDAWVVHNASKKVRGHHVPSWMHHDPKHTTIPSRERLLLRRSRFPMWRGMFSTPFVIISGK